MPLTDTEIRKAKAGAKPARSFDGGGLYLQISPTGAKLWRFKYRFDGWERLLAFGTYPRVAPRRSMIFLDDFAMKPVAPCSNSARMQRE
jgi:hypothetical protein